MHLHILGICGTFMGGLAALAQADGHRVTGCDANVYPPMSSQLRSLGIELTEGYDAAQLEAAAANTDWFVVGNVITRGNPLIEAILDRGLPYTSGPGWLRDHVLQNRFVLAVAGTHGKTTTAAMLAWILDHAGLSPGYLIGGVPLNFGVSARPSDSSFFVMEADEYDTAFFDKRSKFVHYRPRTLVLNNLEYDHADIFADLAAIETQFHHLIRTVPSTGRLVVNAEDANLERVLARGCWSSVERFAGAELAFENGVLPQWRIAGDGKVTHAGAPQGMLRWPGDSTLCGRHTRLNAIAAIIAARHAGVPVERSLEALAEFRGVKRRLERLGEVRGVTVYDDFAHHPTAIASTVGGLRRAVGARRIIAVLEPRSNTMKLGTVKAELPASLREADHTFCFAPGTLGWNPSDALAPLGYRVDVHRNLDQMVQAIAGFARAGDHVLIMSNGAFGGVHDKLLKALG
ncbi:MAG TPA: UDP-N-acetylmuramate:L-alanyl-gamma-D-glutamyl-meso-diaminopimelate ligase [Casimicrobiaceae bacterium]|nr:UDP-N-acetylmuramate:L-alanyl-gamma-D-glutamyl-meso-diaminopimelate ligase [Casimicrobiaceae bacterium]